MDGEPAAAGPEVEAHLATCLPCRSFAEAAVRTRAAVRIREADRVPDLVGVIMARLEALPPSERAIPAPARPSPAHRVEAARRWRRSLPVAAALVAGAVLGSVLVGGPFRGRDREAVSAEAVVRGVRGASSAMRSFDATYEIVERGFARLLPVRRFDMRVAFLAPQRFRLDIDDTTAYPPGSSTVPLDMTVVEDATAIATTVSAPTGCGPGTPGCPAVRTTVTTGRSSGLADLIVPLTTLGSAGGVRILGTGTVDERAIVRVELPFARAAPMFPFLELGDGGWRPFFQGDRVELLLDADTWMPRRMTVFPAASEARRAWEFRFGLPVEHPATPILDVRAVSAGGEPDAGRFAIDGSERLAVGELADAIGFRPAIPADTGDLELATVAAPRGPGGRRSLLVFADGLDYLRVSERDGATRGMFGCASRGAAVEVAGGIASYAIADGVHGRCLAFAGDGTTVVLETNLPRPELLAIAASLPVGTGGTA